MATLQQDRTAFSTLEWVWDSETLTAPEPQAQFVLARDENGLQLDLTASGLEVR